MRALVVEDDAALARGIAEDLAAAGFRVDRTTSGREALHLGATEPYAVVILDLGLPDLPGLEVLRRWRAQGCAVPVLVLTARDAWSERVEGLRAGADDYLGKPFHPEELLERIRALLRRGTPRLPGPLRAAGLALDETRQSVVTPDGAEHPLTATEFRLLRALMLRSGRIVPRATLVDETWGIADAPESNALEVHIARLRRKIGRHRIRALRGQGYLLDPGAA
ncbi:response regulator transcription factor [Inmirania thermothiophila]|uniref:DNA-binding response OmpR family regulator n=1 Tax=Inmirania thermothiophila TaxID=1750597 RepID=A0A3N1Y734_9GAMM|nr:response regulator transcription factor [Inmirania thermothiophila]ROR34639.1 DNA-binding response OmpR family regulator [Inmirania thermothiophila]